MQAVLRRWGPLGLLATMAWLLVGDLGIAMRDRWANPTGTVILREFGASDTRTALLLATLPALINLLVVPYVGRKSDRFRSRWGRRRPFLAVAAVIGALAMLAAAATPWLAVIAHLLLGSASPGVPALELGMFCVFWVIFDCAAISTAALFNGLVNDVVPAVYLGRFFAAVRIVGLTLAIAFHTSLLPMASTARGAILAAIGLVFGCAVLLMCAKTRERDYGPPPAPASLTRLPLLATLADRRYHWTYAMFACAAVSFGPFNTFTQHYAQQYGMSLAELGRITALGYGVSIVSAFGVGWLVDRLGALRVSAVALSAYSMMAAAGVLWVRDAAAFELVYLGHVMVSGVFFTAALSLPMSLFPSADFVRYNATKDILASVANIIVSSVQGPLLDWSGHDYRLTLASGAAFSGLSLLCMARLLGQPRDQ